MSPDGAIEPNLNSLIDISVIVPNYQGASRIEACLSAVIFALKNANLSYEVIVSDDASTDNSVEIIRRTFSEVKVITSAKNLGFSANFNRGLNKSQGRLVMALNNDVILDRNYFLGLNDKFTNDKKLFAIMGAIYSLENKLIDAAKFPHVPYFLCLGGLRTTTNVYHDEHTVLPTLFASGANALMDGKKLRLLGGFDEIYSPYYMEDVDLGVRAYRKGWHSLFFPQSKCIHEVSGTISKISSKAVLEISRANRLLFHSRHLSGFTRSLWLRLQKLRTSAEIWRRYQSRLNLVSLEPPPPKSLRQILSEQIAEFKRIEQKTGIRLRRF